MFFFKSRWDRHPRWKQLKDLASGADPDATIRIYINQLESCSLSEELPAIVRGHDAGDLSIEFDRSNGHVITAGEFAEALRIASYRGDDQPAYIGLVIPDGKRTHSASLSNGYEIRADDDDPNTLYIEGEIVYDKNMTTYMG